MTNAEALMDSAKTLKGESTSHIRYHLAVLALEEVGKAVISQMNAFGTTSDMDDNGRRISTDDHVKKLFWVFFSPLIEEGRITRKYIESYRGMARRIHERRLKSFYTDLQNPLLPHERMVQKEADDLVRFCETRIKIEKGVELSDVPDESKLEVLQWFRTASDNPDMRPYLFSKTSLDKLSALGNLFEWMAWHRQEFTVADEESRDYLRRELQKEPIDRIEDNEPKWKVKFRIYSASHSIRKKALNEWNSHSDFIMKLHGSNNRSELICEFILPRSVHIKALWHVARARCREFVAALNIASTGLFWWHVDKDIAKFYEKIWDLENDNAEVRLSVSPQLSIDWEHQSLTEVNLKDTRFILGYLLKDIHSNPHKKETVENYLTGLVLLSKNDIHLQLESNAFTYFFTALKTLLLLSGEWDGVGDISTAAVEQLGELFSPQNLSDYIAWGMQLENRNDLSKRITLTEAIQMKNFCDIYFYLSAHREFVRNRNLANSSED